MRALFIVLALTGAALAGMWIQSVRPAATTVSPETAGQQTRPLYWVAPMDPNFRRDAPGKSPMGMDLVPVYGEEADSADTVRVDAAIAASLGLRSAEATFGPLTRTVRTIGYVSYDEDSLKHIHSRVEGWIEDLAVRNTGSTVRAGQTLMSLYSPPLVTAQQEYVSARASGNAVMQRASAERLRAMGMTDGQLAELSRTRKASDRVRIVAEADGIVAHLFVREGMFVAPATHLASLGDLSAVWLHAEVLERQADWVSVGAAATVRLDAHPGRQWSGVVDFIYPELDPTTRTLKVRLRLDNDDGALLPNMLADVVIASPSGESRVHVPREAVIRGGETDRVVLAIGDGRFRVAHVQTGIEAGGRVAILSGIASGDRVVVSGQFLIDSEANVSAETLRLESAPAENPDDPGQMSHPPGHHHGMDHGDSMAPDEPADDGAHDMHDMQAEGQP